MKFITFCAAAMLILALSACNYMPSFGRDDNPQETGLRADELKTDITVDEARALAKPAKADEGFTINSATLQTENNNGLQPPRGLNTRRLFEESIRDEDDRFARVENAVQGMRDEFDELSPSIKRLIAVEKDIQELSSQLQVLIGNEGGSPELTVENLENDQGAIAQAMGAGTAPLMPEAQTPPQMNTVALPSAMPAMLPPGQQPTGEPLRIAPPPPPMTPSGQNATGSSAMDSVLDKTMSKASPPSVPPVLAAAAPTPPPPPMMGTGSTTGSGPRLTNIRMADNPGKTRLVLESNAAMSYNADLDNSENILTLVFDSGTNDPSLASLPTRSRLIKSINITPQSNGGFVAAIALTKGSRIIDQGKLPPGAANPNHRIYIDLAN